MRVVALTLAALAFGSTLAGTATGPTLKSGSSFAGPFLYDCNGVPVSCDPRKDETLAWDVLPPCEVSRYFGTSEGVPISREAFDRLLPPAARRHVRSGRNALGSK